MSTAGGRIAKLTRGKASTLSEEDQQQADKMCSQVGEKQTTLPSRSCQQVKVKSASVESNQNLVPTIRCSTLNLFVGDDEDNGCESSTSCSPIRSAQSSEADKSTTSTGKLTKSSGMKNFLSIGPFSPLRPSLSTSCVFTSSSSADADCYRITSPDLKQQQQQVSSTSALVCIPTRASLTHEWRKLKTPNKCRECNLLVYFNGRECAICGFVAHKKCITMLVIKCHRNQSSSPKSGNKFLQKTDQAPSIRAGLGASLFASLGAGGSGNQNIRSPFSGGGYSLYGNRKGNKPALLSQQQQQSWPCFSHQQQRPIFGQPISINEADQVLDFIQRFIYEIDTRGLTSKGIYRVSSIKSKVDKLCNYYDQNLSSLIDLSSFHPNIIANALKMYLRRLPEPLLTNDLYEQFIEIAKKHSSPGFSSRLQACESARRSKEPHEGDQKHTRQAEHRPSFQHKLLFGNSKSAKGHQQAQGHNKTQGSISESEVILRDFELVIEKLPPVNKQMVAFIMRHLKRVADMAEENQMSAKNLSIIFGPTLLSASEKSSLAIVDNIHQAQLVELMINFAYQIFPSSYNEHHD